MIIVDASVLIAHLDAHDALHARAGGALTEAADKPLASSLITLAEVLVGPARRGRLEAARTALMELGVEELSLGHDAPVRLATLRAETRLRLPHCCVLLAAQDAAAEMIIPSTTHCRALPSASASASADRSALGGTAGGSAPIRVMTDGGARAAS